MPSRSTANSTRWRPSERSLYKTPQSDDPSSSSYASRSLDFALRLKRPNRNAALGTTDFCKGSSQAKVRNERAALGTRRQLLLFVPRFVGIHHRQQRRSQEDSPERNQNTQHDWSQQRSPDRHPGHALHDV